VLECSVCATKGGGLGGATLYKIDGRYYCKRCLVKTKGTIKCGRCGVGPESTNDYFQTLGSQYYCKSCLPSMVAAAQPAAGASGGGAKSEVHLPIHQFVGALKQLYAEAVKPTEQVLFALSGSAGEGLVATDARLLVLKSGLATGLGANRVTAIAYSACSGVSVERDAVHGRFVVQGSGHPDLKGADWQAARSALNCVTFLADSAPLFEQAASVIKSKLGAATATRVA
jgi:hypothetical protein